MTCLYLLGVRKEQRLTQLFNALKKVLNFSAERYLKTAGDLFIYQGEYESALLMVEKTLEIEPQDPRALALKGDILYCLNRDLEALDVFNSLLAIYPTSLEALASKAAVLDVLGKYREALNCCNAALANLSDKSHYLLGSLYEQKLLILIALRRYREADTLLKQALLELDKTSKEYLVANYKGTIEQNLKYRRKLREYLGKHPYLKIV